MTRKYRRFKGLHFEVTHRCNLRCVHCYNIKYLESGALDLSLSEVKKVIDIAVSIGCEAFGFTGGEPFARKDFIEILEYTPSPIHILTNGLFVRESHCQAIADMKKLVEFRVSLDGLESHKAMRGVDYTSVTKKIQMLRRHGFIVSVNTMLTPYNAAELPKMFDLMKDLEIDRWRLDFLFEGGNAARNSLLVDFDTTLAQVKFLVERYLAEKPSFAFDISKVFRSTLINGRTKPISYTHDSRPCDYQGALTIRPNGDVSFCASYEETFGNILRDSLDEIIANKNWRRFSEVAVKDLSGCHGCDLLAMCGGGCRADAFYSSGSLTAKDSAACRIMRFSRDHIWPLIAAHNARLVG